jgi:RNA polymerase sigma-70 factor (ECF subfamily)
MGDEMAFESTFWTRIERAREDPVALEEIVRRYRAPILEYLRRRGLADADAEDLAQEVFVQVCRPEFLRRADRTRGRFRTLLLTVTRHALITHRRRDAAQKRGGGSAPVSLEQGGPEGRSLEDLLEDPRTDAEFDRLWVAHVMRQALDRVRSEERPDGPPYGRALALFLEGQKYREIAAHLAASEQDVANWIHQARLRVKRFAREAIEEYVSSPGELREELHELLGHLT